MEHAIREKHPVHEELGGYEGAKMGMWLFLATELLLFGVLFAGFALFHTRFLDSFKIAHHSLDKVMGGTNTIVLIVSSMSVALALDSIQRGRRKLCGYLLLVTIALASTFLVIKYFEYTHKFHAGLLPGHYFHPHADHIKGGTSLPASGASFFAIYFMMTGVHGVHVIVGIGVLIWILMRNMRGDFSREYFTPVDVTALYWHLVDLVWIYLFPLLYLI